VTSGKNKTLLFSITKEDFIIQTFCSGGKGGQHQNATQSGVRIIHKDSGARGESREHRHQHQNKEAAFKRLVETKVFKAWHRQEVARRLGQLDLIERTVDALMQDHNIKVEYESF
jgi:protein subunit release factor A